MTRFDLKDKVAIVTGGTGGIGTSISKMFSEAGARIVVADLKVNGGESLAIATDVTIPEQVDNMVQQTMDMFGRIDILVNNAGGAVALGKPEELSPANWNATIALNLTGTFLCSVAAGRAMIGQKSGKIINISSVVGIKGGSDWAPYGAAKAGVINLTLSLATAWAAHNVNVNCIAPGVVATPDMKSAGSIHPREKPDGTLIPSLLYPCDPENVADLALFLASSASDHLTGECIPIRGMQPDLLDLLIR